MKAVGGRHIYSLLTANVCRFLLAACLVFSGFVKAVDPVGTQIKFQEYLTSFGISMISAGDVLLMSCVLAGFEFLLGIYLLLGVYRRGTSLVVLILFAVFTPFTLYLAINNPVTDCGCFGDALTLTNRQTFAKNLFFLILAVLLLCNYRRVVSFVSRKRSWAVPVITVLLVGHFMLSNIRDLPVFDFRPYKVGTDLKASVLAGTDDTFSDFSLLDARMNDVTEDVLTDEGYTFLLVSPYLTDASQENIDLINDLYYYCLDNGYNMYCLTSSGRKEIAGWKDITCAEYDFLLSDEIVLKTMIRSNPGIVVLKNGVIQAKWSDGNIPLDFNEAERMEELEQSHPFMAQYPGRWILVLLYFLLPYLLLMLTDRKRKN